VSPDAPKVSVVMATYNRADTLPRAIDSVLAQTCRDWELIIVDDGSTDDTVETLARYADERIRTYRHDQNKGATGAKNTGFDHLSGEWFTILDSDDEMVPDALEAMLDYAQRFGATAITCNCRDSQTGEMTGLGHTGDGWLSTEEAARHPGEHWGLTQTALLGDLRFDERLPTYEDTVWLKINVKARRYYVHRALRIYHTEGNDGVIRTLGGSGFSKKVRNFAAIGDDEVYLRLLKEANPARHRHLMRRVRIARVLRPFMPARTPRTTSGD
jgi:GalNAc5-diNAcBac-PP-undecaprenol beta-1,3-glucosyltransferase